MPPTSPSDSSLAFGFSSMNTTGAAGFVLLIEYIVSHSCDNHSISLVQSVESIVLYTLLVTLSTSTYKTSEKWDKFAVRAGFVWYEEAHTPSSALQV
jgi:hypothetical protein